jgi:hypothetical protein
MPTIFAWLRVQCREDASHRPRAPQRRGPRERDTVSLHVHEQPAAGRRALPAELGEAIVGAAVVV